jgi:hypothetical protein
VPRNPRPNFGTEQKVATLRRHLVDTVPISDLCTKYEPLLLPTEPAPREPRECDDVAGEGAGAREDALKTGMPLCPITRRRLPTCEAASAGGVFAAPSTAGHLGRRPPGRLRPGGACPRAHREGVLIVEDLLAPGAGPGVFARTERHAGQFSAVETAITEVGGWQSSDVSPRARFLRGCDPTGRSSVCWWGKC